MGGLHDQLARQQGLCAQPPSPPIALWTRFDKDNDIGDFDIVED
jgi:hypothetical protein